MGPSGGALTAGREDCDGGRPSLPSLGAVLQGSSPLHPVLWVTCVSPEMLQDLSKSNEKILTTTASIIQQLSDARRCGKCSTGTTSFNSTKTPRNVHNYVPHLTN